MALTEDDMKGLRLILREELQIEVRPLREELQAEVRLLREELEAEVRPFRNEVGKRFDEIATQIDGLYQRDEKREQEYYSSANRSDASKSDSLS
jgi:ribosome recycling factor